MQLPSTLRDIDDSRKDRVPRFVAYTCGRDAELAHIPRALEAKVFLETFGNTKNDLDREYSPYEARSFFLFVYDHADSRAAAMARIIIPNAVTNLQTKTTDDIESLWGLRGTDIALGGRFLKDENYWDVATLAVDRTYKGPGRAGIVSLAIYNTIMTSAMHCGVDVVIAILDEVAYRTSKWQYHEPFKPLDTLSALPYMGSSSSLPVYCEFSAVKARLEMQKPDIAKMLFTTKDIGDAIQHVDLEEVRLLHKDLAARNRHVIDIGLEDQTTQTHESYHGATRTVEP